MPRNSSNNRSNNNDGGNSNKSNDSRSRESNRSEQPMMSGWRDTAKERPLATAAAVAGAVGAGVFLWSRRNQITDQISSLSEQISDWAGNMQSGSSSDFEMAGANQSDNMASMGGSSSGSSSGSGSSRATGGSGGGQSMTGAGTGGTGF